MQAKLSVSESKLNGMNDFRIAKGMLTIILYKKEGFSEAEDEKHYKLSQNNCRP